MKTEKAVLAPQTRLMLGQAEALTTGQGKDRLGNYLKKHGLKPIVRRLAVHCWDTLAARAGINRERDRADKPMEHSADKGRSESPREQAGTLLRSGSRGMSGSGSWGQGGWAGRRKSGRPSHGQNGWESREPGG